MHLRYRPKHVKISIRKKASLKIRAQEIINDFNDVFQEYDALPDEID